MSKFVDWTEKKTSTIFADGAGAVVVQLATDAPGFLGAKLVADGSYHDHMGVYAGGTYMPIDERVLAENFYTKVRFAKKYPPEVNIEGWQRIVRDVLAKCQLTTDDVSLFLFTQVNLSTIKIVMEAMNLPMSRTHTVMGKWGYTGSACIPMVLDDAVREGKLERGQVVVMCASGGGLNMACAAFRF
jgi:3-oxoacyl-[acyl-carrier-protein] synthase-3